MNCPVEVDSPLEADHRDAALRYLATGRQRQVAIAVALGLAALAAVVSIGIGSLWLPVGEVLNAIWAGPSYDSAAAAVVWQLRIPRILIALAVGSALAVSGAAYQAAYRNPLVDPSILGVSAGAAFGAGLALIFPTPLGMTAGAFCGGLLAVLATYKLSSVGGERPTLTVILSGVVVGAIFTAGFGLLQYIGTNEQLRRLVFWMLGGFYEATWSQVAIVIPGTLVLLVIMATMGWDLNVLSMGDQDAHSVGRDPDKVRRRVLIVATALTALAVSVSGIVGWVGLLVPHAARLIVGADNRWVIPLSAAMGGLFTLVADDVARTVGTGEIPIGIITSLLGAPYLLYLLRSRAASMVGS